MLLNKKCCYEHSHDWLNFLKSENVKKKIGIGMAQLFIKPKEFYKRNFTTELFNEMAYSKLFGTDPSFLMLMMVRVSKTFSLIPIRSQILFLLLLFSLLSTLLSLLLLLFPRFFPLPFFPLVPIYSLLNGKIVFAIEDFCHNELIFKAFIRSLKMK